MGNTVFDSTRLVHKRTRDMLSITINGAKYVCATVINKHNYMQIYNHKIVINILMSLLNSAYIHKSRSIVDFPTYDDT